MNRDSVDAVNQFFYYMNVFFNKSQSQQMSIIAGQSESWPDIGETPQDRFSDHD